ncbi:MAG: Hpt domain-containing protein, partial [Methylococcaceae bacterium]|nr:Hpt domain-containing protein [Methylococcaceae bacterium]
MSNEEEEFQKHLLDIFRVEAHERLTTLSSGLIELEQAEADGRRAEVLEVLVRDAHSLKGAARVVNLAEMVALGRGMESVLTALKRQEIAAAAELFDILHAAVDGAGRFLAAAQTETAAKETADLLDSIRAMEQAAVGGSQPQAPIKIVPFVEPPIETPLEAPPLVREQASLQTPPIGVLAPAERPASSETVRIPAARLGALLLEAEQLLSSKLAAEHYVSELKSVHRILGEWEKELAKIGSTLRRSSLAKQAGKSALVDLLDAENQRIKLLRNRLGMLERSTEQNYHFLSIAVTNLLEDMKGILMLPFSTLLEIFPKMVRDLSRDRGKEVDLIVAGGNIEIDKRILDELKDALIHLVRNCIDHGIERPEVREGKGKPRRGKLSFSVAQKDAGKVEISFEDDGAGMDAGKIRAAAVKSGVLSAAEAKKLSDEEAQFLVFRSGVTTSPTVTDISGRG